MLGVNFCEKEVITLDPCLVIYLEEGESDLFDELEVTALEPQELITLDSLPYSTSNESEGFLWLWFVRAMSHEGPQDKELQQASRYFEDGVTLAAKRIVEINVGTYHEPHPTFLGSDLEEWERQRFVKLLRSYKDYFVWFYDEMSILSTEILVYRIAFKSSVRPVA